MTTKAKVQAKRTAAKKESAAPAKGAMKRLETENQELQARLKDAEQKVALLQRQRDDALNRLEWVIDSIRTLSEEVRKSV